MDTKHNSIINKKLCIICKNSDKSMFLPFLRNAMTTWEFSTQPGTVMYK